MSKSSANRSAISLQMGPEVWRRVIAVFILGSAVLLLTGQAPPLTRTIRAERFELVSADGKVIAVLGSNQGSEGLTLLDRAGRTQMALQMTAKGPAIEVRDRSGVKRATLACEDDGPIFTLHDSKGEGRFVVAVNPNPALALMDSAGHLGTAMAVTDLGSALALHDRRGKRRLSLSVADSSDLSGPLLSLSDETGVMRATFGTVGGETRLIINSPDGKGKIGLTATDRGALVNLLDSAGVQRVLLGVLSGSAAIGLNDAAERPRAVLAVGGDEQKLELFDAEGKKIAGLP